MRNRKHYSIIAVLCGGLFGFTSCSDIGDTALNGQPVAVQFSTGHTAKPVSRVTDAGEWETTDCIGIYMVQSGKTLAATTVVGEADNRKYLPGSQAATATLSPDGASQTIYYPQSGTVDFIAYYPWVDTGTSAGQINNYQYPVDLNNQKKAANYLISRDAKGKDKKAGAVTLNFSRMLTKLVMTLEASASSELTGSDLADITPITLTAPLTANYALADGAITSVGNNTTVSLGAVQQTSGVYTVEAIVLPGTGTGREVAFTLPESAGGGTLTWIIPGEMDFAPGTKYKYTLTLDRTGVKTGTFTTQDWTGVDDDPTEIDYVPESWSDPNCYIISTNGGSVDIPVRKAYDMWRYHPWFRDANPNLSGELTAELLWMDNNGLITNAANLEVMGNSEDAIIKAVTAADKTGNAVVAVKIGGEIRWSWHLWVTGEDVTETTYNYNNYTFMDRNLGAINATVGDAGSKGLLYQWGRKDPFVGSSDWTDSNYTKMYDANGSEISGSNPVTPPTDPTFNFGIFTKRVTGATTNIAAAVTQPQVFYDVSSGSPWNASNDLSANELWGHSGDKSPFDPCPAGWRVPAFENGKSPWNGLTPPSGQTGTVFTNTNKGYNWDALGYYPASGRRANDSGVFGSVGAYGYYWSASPYSATNGYNLYFSSSSVSSTYNSSRTGGFAVRCLSES